MLCRFSVPGTVAGSTNAVCGMEQRRPSVEVAARLEERICVRLRHRQRFDARQAAGDSRTEKPGSLRRLYGYL